MGRKLCFTSFRSNVMFRRSICCGRLTDLSTSMGYGANWRRFTATRPRAKFCAPSTRGARDLARDIATTDAYVISRRERKKVEMLFAHLKRILKLDRLRLRGPNGARDEFHLAATAQNLRKLAMLIPAPAPTPAA